MLVRCGDRENVGSGRFATKDEHREGLPFFNYKGRFYTFVRRH